MAASDWQESLTILTAEAPLPALPGALDEVNGALADAGAFSCLMADYWNSPGTFSEYATGRPELTRRIADCISGSAFGEETEVRWRKVGNVFRMLLVAEADLSRLPSRGTQAYWQPENVEVERVRRGNDRRDERYIMLWGSRRLEDGSWVEARIPRRLTYPTVREERDSFDHVRLHFVEYPDERGRVVIHRRTHLTAHLCQPESEQETQQRGEESHDETTR